MPFASASSSSLPVAPNKFVRDVSQVSRPPPCAARFFYTSTYAIDDPLSPLPPIASTTAASKIPPRPFSVHDHGLLEKCWLDLRRKRVKLSHEAQSTPAGNGEVAVSKSPRQSQNATSTSMSRSSSGSSKAAPKRQKTLLSEVSNSSNTIADSPVREDRSEADFVANSTRGSRSGSTNTVEHISSPTTGRTTGTPFIRAPSRSSRPKSAQAEGHERSSKRNSLDGAEEMEQDAQRKAKKAKSAVDSSPRVPVGVSRIHNVQMPSLKMEPTYWSPIGDTADVMRATWFYRDTMLPIETDIANLLEAGYVALEPWTETWEDELKSAVDVGAAGEAKILHRLWPDKPPNQPSSRPSTSRATEMSSGQPSTEEEDDPEKARSATVASARSLIDVATAGSEVDNTASGTSSFGRDGRMHTYLPAGIIYANNKEAYILRPGLQPSAYYGRRPLANYIRKGHKIGIPVVRGFDQKLWDQLHPQKGRAVPGKLPRELSSQALTQSGNQHPGRLERPKVTDLILVIHGIGQKLSERIESFNFTHSINAFRREMNVELGTDAVKMHLRGDMGDVMILPINWRASLSFEEGGYRDPESDDSTNKFSLGDITPETLPSVRNIISDVMFDIPYYLSSEHNAKMISACIEEANRVYRLWCSNNPGFCEYGRVHLIAHSLGSVMAMDVLSKQPTSVPPSLGNPATKAEELPTDHFLFNTHSLFVCGSPVGFFLLLKRATLLPRRDLRKNDDLSASIQGEDVVESTQSVGSASAYPRGVAGDRGTYGCIAVQNIYNIMNPYDPVAYQLNATIDSAYAAALKPAVIPPANNNWFYNPFRTSSLSPNATAPAPGFHGSSPSSALLANSAASASAAVESFASSAQAVAASASASSASASAAINALTTAGRLPSNVELDTHNFSREEIASLRAHALNDNGQVDYRLSWGGGALGMQYLTMLGAHSSYWVSRDFVRMIAVEVGRVEGRHGTIRGMRAVKKGRKGAF